MSKISCCGFACLPPLPHSVESAVPAGGYGKPMDGRTRPQLSHNLLGKLLRGDAPPLATVTWKTADAFPQLHTETTTTTILIFLERGIRIRTNIRPTWAHQPSSLGCPPSPKFAVISTVRHTEKSRGSLKKTVCFLNKQDADFAQHKHRWQVRKQIRRLGWVTSCVPWTLGIHIPSRSPCARWKRPAFVEYPSCTWSSATRPLRVRIKARRTIYLANRKTFLEVCRRTT
jgi:hypothetical protein